MPHDPARVAETRAWLAKARLDLRAAEHDRTASPPITADIVFHAQQMVEKAFLTRHDEPFRKTHSLIELGEPCADLAPDLGALLHRAAPLTGVCKALPLPGRDGRSEHPGGG